MTSIHALQSELRHHQLMKEELLRRFPEENEQSLHDTLSGLSSLEEMIAAMVDLIEEDEHLAAAIGSRIAALAERATRLERGVQNKKAALQYVMSEAAMKSLVLPSVTLSLRNNPPTLIITNPDAVPQEFFVYPEAPPPRIDKKTLLHTLKGGAEIPGASLSNGGQSLTWRTK